MSTFLELVIAFIIGLVLTENVLQPEFEHFGIGFTGNVWINWFGVSILLFVYPQLLFGKLKTTII